MRLVCNGCNILKINIIPSAFQYAAFRALKDALL